MGRIVGIARVIKRIILSSEFIKYLGIQVNGNISMPEIVIYILYDSS